MCFTEFYADFLTYPLVILLHTIYAPNDLCPAMVIMISSALSLILALLSPSLLNSWLNTDVCALPGSIWLVDTFSVACSNYIPLDMIYAILSPMACPAALNAAWNVAWSFPFFLTISSHAFNPSSLIAHGRENIFFTTSSPNTGINYSAYFMFSGDISSTLPSSPSLCWSLSISPF